MVSKFRFSKIRCKEDKTRLNFKGIHFSLFHIILQIHFSSLADFRSASNSLQICFRFFSDVLFIRLEIHLEFKWH